MNTDRNKLKTNFFICSDRRTGSHMLASALNQHSQLRMAGEIFVRPSRFGLRPLSQAEASETGVLDAYIDEAYASFSGFIVHRNLPRCIEALGRRQDVAVIFLSRRQWLAEFASNRIAEHTQSWHVPSEAGEFLSDDGARIGITQPEIAVSVDDALAYLDAIIRREIGALRQLRSLRQLPVMYEDLVDNWDDCIRRICTFLNIPVEPLKPQTARQESRPISSVIKNWGEIDRFFSGTRWSVPRN
ncbi:MAG TPA: hypothetical protein VHO24_12085 [Opitutaceae bacterium]|nr:hypothetical protein [Opitutaceae bacterium]